MSAPTHSRKSARGDGWGTPEESVPPFVSRATTRTTTTRPFSRPNPTLGARIGIHALQLSAELLGPLALGAEPFLEIGAPAPELLDLGGHLIGKLHRLGLPGLPSIGARLFKELHYETTSITVLAEATISPSGRGEIVLQRGPRIVEHAVEDLNRWRGADGEPEARHR